MREPSLREVAVERIHKNAPVAIASLGQRRLLLHVFHRHDHPSRCAPTEKHIFNETPMRPANVKSR